MATEDGRRINVEDAKIRTATVEIKTLTVSGKQVTLAVFRQLKEETFFDQDARGFPLLGTLWGVVNYCPADCGLRKSDYTHDHVVWQKGDELRRCAVSRQAGEMFIHLEDKQDREDWDRLRATWLALDQLFIAV